MTTIYPNSGTIFQIKEILNSILDGADLTGINSYPPDQILNMIFDEANAALKIKLNGGTPIVDGIVINDGTTPGVADTDTGIIWVDSSNGHIMYNDDASNVYDLTSTGAEGATAYRDYIAGDPGSDPDIGRVRLYFDSDGILRALDSSGDSVSVYDDGHDIDANGNYLLNDQTTTNMMSKGTAYRFDVGDYITANGIATHTNCDGAGLGVWFRYHNTGANQRLLYWGDDNANETLGLSIAADDDKISGTFKLAATDQWSFDTPALTDGAEYFMYFTHNGTEPLIYLNGVLQTLTYSITFDKTKWLGDTNAIDTFVWGGIDYNSAGINATFNSEISHGIAFNTLLTASEVKDLSANTPFKWIGASQTTKVTNGDFGADSDWTEGGDTAIGAGVAVITTSAVPTRGTLYQDAPSNFVAGKEYSVSLDIDAISNNLYFQVRDAGGTEQVSASQTYTTMGTKTFNFIALVSSSTAGAHFQVDNTAAHTATVDNVVITQIGVVADYPSHGISETHWTDASGNNNDGAVTGCEVLNQTDGQAFKNIILSPVGQDATPKEGQLIYNSATNKLNVWTGAAWEVVTSS